MAEPTLTTAGERLYDSLSPLMVTDAANGYAGAYLCGALGTMLDKIVYAVSDNQDGDLPGWAPIFDPVNSPEWLDWMGQFVGVIRPVGINDAGMTTLVQHPVGFNRGSPAAIEIAIQATLTGTKTVFFNIRAGGNPFSMTIATFTSETPNAQLTLLAIQSQMPAWMQFTYSTITAGTYAELAASHASYTLMEAMHTTYSDVRANPGA